MNFENFASNEMQMRSIYLLAIIFLAALLSCNAPNSDHTDQTGEAKGIDSMYLHLGDEITAKAQATLLQNVSGAMEKGGPTYAIEFCNLKAMPLLDSLSRVHEVDISRISQRHRNPLSAPKNALENNILQEYASNSSKDIPLESVTLRMDEKITYFKPIKIGLPACLKCHGDTQVDIAAQTLAKINDLYPNDKATGYKMAEFRGVWKVTFEEQLTE